MICSTGSLAPRHYGLLLVDLLANASLAQLDQLTVFPFLQVCSGPEWRAVSL
jgi:hypothetical protein